MQDNYVSWLKMLFTTELASITDGEIIDPGISVSPQEQVIGAAGNDAKKLYTLRYRLKRAAAELAVRMEFSQDEAEKHEAVKKLVELKVKSETIDKIFWTSIYDQFNLWEKVLEGKTVGIRKDFVVVIFTEQPKKDFLNFLKDLLE